MLGFQHLYILDSSTDTRCISFLRYARDSLGVNVLFSDANLNQLEGAMTKIGKEIAGASDYIMKFDTDEFLVVYDENTQTLTTSVSDYLAKFKLASGDSRVGYVQNSIPSREVCSKDVHSTPEKFPLIGFDFIGKGEKSRFKMVYDAKILLNKKRKINLGGHAFGLKDGIWTNFGVVHFHSRCVEIEVENCKRVIERHEMIKPTDTDEQATAALASKFGCKTDDICNQCNFKGGFPSWHKASFYLKWLNCREETEAVYYDIDASKGQQNTDLTEALETSHELFSLQQ